jgi:hypothetical protein
MKEVNYNFRMKLARGGSFRRACDSCGPYECFVVHNFAANLAAQPHPRGRRNEKLRRSDHPKPVPQRRTVAPKSLCEKSHNRAQ